MRLYYNQAGLGTEPSIITHYLYDAGGNRVKKLTRTQGGNWECITYIDGLIEFREDHIGQKQSISHIMDDSKRIVSVRKGHDFGDSTPEIKYNMYDHLGSSNVSVDDNGTLVNREEYYPFGETSFGSYSKKRYRFCGKEKDEESGLYYYGARYYSPWTCRFISVDPQAGKYIFQTPYAYADNNPICKMDYNGEGTIEGGEASGDGGQQSGKPANSTPVVSGATTPPTLDINKWDTSKQVAKLGNPYKEKGIDGTLRKVEGTYVFEYDNLDAQGNKQFVYYDSKGEKGQKWKDFTPEGYKVSYAPLPVQPDNMSNGVTLPEAIKNVQPILDFAEQTCIWSANICMIAMGGFNPTFGVTNSASTLSATSASEVVAIGISGEAFTAAKITEVFAVNADDVMVTIFRGATGSESGGGALFLAETAEYEATYAQNGTVLTGQISTRALYFLRNNGLIDGLNGINSFTNTGGKEIMISNPYTRNLIIGLLK